MQVFLVVLDSFSLVPDVVESGTLIPVALMTGLLFGRSCCGKHTTIPMPLDTADRKQDLRSFRTHSQCIYWEP